MKIESIIINKSNAKLHDYPLFECVLQTSDKPFNVYANEDIIIRFLGESVTLVFGSINAFTTLNTLLGAHSKFNELRLLKEKITAGNVVCANGEPLVVTGVMQ